MPRVNHLTISGGIHAGKTQAALAYAASALSQEYPVLLLVDHVDMIPVFRRRLADICDGADRRIEVSSIRSLCRFHCACLPYRTVVLDARAAPSEWEQVKGIAQRAADVFGLSWLVTTQDTLTL